MNIDIIVVGKTKSASPESKLILEYEKRVKFSIKHIEITAQESITNESQRKSKEAEKILSKIDSQKYVISLDERGEAIDSHQFAQLIDKNPKTSFIIGGAYGLDETIRKRSDKVISFGKMVFPHRLVKVLLIEQIYRAITIINNHPYHK